MVKELKNRSLSASVISSPPIAIAMNEWRPTSVISSRPLISPSLKINS
jgi:hypothetical protein